MSAAGAAGGAVGGAATGAATGGMFAGLPGLLVGSLVGGLAGSLPFMFMGNGMPSEEEQERMLRRQLEIQDEFEQQRSQRMGGGMDEAGLVGGGPPMSLASMMADERETRSLANIARSLRRSPFEGMNPELEELLAGSTARLAALQSQRPLSPIEVMQLLEGIDAA